MGPLTVLMALAAGYGIYELVRSLASKEATPQKPVSVHEVIRTTLAVLAFVAAVLAGVYAYRKQRLAEGDAHRADDNQLAERYTTAADQLGHDQAAVRLAGVYAMARLADDWTEQRQVCIDVLCAYLRMPYEPDPEADTYKEGEREVRHTIIRVIRDHLQPQAPTSWSACDFDFTHATFDGGDLSGSQFQGAVSFGGAEFTGGMVSFDGTEFTGATVSFGAAEFTGGMVSFDDARFRAGMVSFDDAEFTGATVSFGAAEFTGGMVSFDDARFRAGEVSFGGAEFTGATVSFVVARFTGGMVSFGAGFRGGEVSFKCAGFTGAMVDFIGAEFTGGTVTFDEAEFTGGTVTFDEAEFTGGTVTFADVRGAPQDWGPFQPPAGSAG